MHFEADSVDPSRNNVLLDGGPVPMAAFLARHDLIVNCVLQHTDQQLILVTDDDLAAFSPGALIVDGPKAARRSGWCQRHRAAPVRLSRP